MARQGEFEDNRPIDIRCVHPLVTLIEKLDAISRRFRRDPIEPASFVRHYEDAARIIRRISSLPPLGQTVPELIEDMLRERDIRHRPSAADPAFDVSDEKPNELVAAYDALDPMYWSERISLVEACASIRRWIRAIA